MNFQTKLLPLLASAIALSLPVGVALPAFSQSANPAPPTERHHSMRHLNFLNLTSDQQTQMDQIREDTRSQIEAILTPDQRAQLQRERDNRDAPRPNADRGMHRLFDTLNLTDDQRSQIETVIRSSKARMDAILTPEQRQQLQQHRQQHEQRHPGNPQTPQPQTPQSN